MVMGRPQAHHGGHEHGVHGGGGVQMLHGQVALHGRNRVLLHLWLVGQLVLVVRGVWVARLRFLRGLRLAAGLWLLGFEGWCLAGVAPVALRVKVLK